MTIYIKFDGVDGNVTAKGHEKWSEATAYGFSGSRTITTHVGSTQDREGGIIRISELGLIKPIDNASPHLFSYFCNGKAFPKVTIVICHSDSQLEAHHSYELHDVLVSRYEDAVIGKNPGAEYIRLNFTKIEKKYTPRNPSGSLGSPLRSNYNLTTAEAG